MRNLVSDGFRFRRGSVSVFDITLRGNLIVVSGDSGVGKTYLFDSIQWMKVHKRQAHITGLDLSRTVLLNNVVLQSLGVSSVLDCIRGRSDCFFIIDDGDRLLSSRVAKYISDDAGRNQYLIFARGVLPFDLTPDCYAVMCNNAGVHQLYYEFCDAGWLDATHNQ